MHISRPVLFISFGLLLSSCSHTPAKLSQEARQSLNAYRLLSNDAAGLVYTGDVFPLAGKTNEPVYRYQRIVERRGDNTQFRHITYDMNGNAVIAQTALTSQDDNLFHFESIDILSGIDGSMEVLDGGGVNFTLSKNGKTKTNIEKPALPLVAGPTLFGFILKHWEVLIHGETIPFAFVLVERMQTMAFRVAYEQSVAGKAVFVVTASNPLMRLFVAPMRVTIDKTTRHPVRYVGRVPPPLVKGGSLSPFDARVEYFYASKEYR